MKEGDVFWAASDVGWVVGHSYSVYGPLLQGCTSLLYEGKPVGTPDEANFWRTISRHRVNALFTAPTAIRAIKRLDPHGELPKQHDLSSLRTIFLAGERADSECIKWAEKSLNIPVRDHWWQTETGWAICANLIGEEGYLPVKYGSTFKATPGYQLKVVDDNAMVLPPNTAGALAIKLPLPPGCLLTLYNNDNRYKDSYFKKFPGYYDTGDEGMIDEEGYVYVMSRKDDVINVAGHRLSTGAIEEVLTSIEHVAEAAVVGVNDSFRGQVPLGLIVLNDEKADHSDAESVIKHAIEKVRDNIGAFAFFRKVVIVDKLPKTRSGKILRGAIRSLANRDKNFKIPTTCDDPTIFEEIDQIIKLHEDDKIV
jgi:propionyl-CoA synthetase